MRRAKVAIPAVVAVAFAFAFALLKRFAFELNYLAINHLKLSFPAIGPVTIFVPEILPESKETERRPTQGQPALLLLFCCCCCSLFVRTFARKSAPQQVKRKTEACPRSDSPMTSAPAV